MRIGESLGERFEVSHVGVETGMCTLTYPLFSLHQLMVSSYRELKRSGYGVEAGGYLIPGLMYADDTALFSGTVDGLKLQRVA